MYGCWLVKKFSRFLKCAGGQFLPKLVGTFSGHCNLQFTILNIVKHCLHVCLQVVPCAGMLAPQVQAGEGEVDVPASGGLQ